MFINNAILSNLFSLITIYNRSNAYAVVDSLKQRHQNNITMHFRDGDTRLLINELMVTSIGRH